MTEDSEENGKAKYRIAKPEHLPIPGAMIIDCPCCGSPIEYEVVDDDAGTWGPQENWPICEPCGVLIDVPSIRITAVVKTYFAERN